MDIQGDKVVVGFSLGGYRIGKDSQPRSAPIRSSAARTSQIEPRGSDTLHPDGVLPVGQTSTPYQIYDAFFDVTKAASGWDIETLSSR